MAFFQLSSPDLSNLSLGGAVLRLLESYGFTADERYLVVRGTYTDDGDPSFGLHYSFWLFDLQTREYVSNFNEQIAGVDNAREIEVSDTQTSGTSGNLFAVALVETKGTDETRLVSLDNGQVVSNNLIHSVSGEQVDAKVERFLLSDDGRFLAIQTSSEQLAAEDAPDTNDSSDIYLLDLQNNSITRISYVGGSEVTDPTYLQDIHVVGDTVKIAFVTDAAFVSPSKIDLNSKNINAEANLRSDAYVWSSVFDHDGLTGSFTFDLLSLDSDSKAAGFVDRDNSVQITDAGSVFTSSAENITEDDINESNDTIFIDNQGQIERIVFGPNNELDNGSVFVSASENGRFISYLSSSSEVSGNTGAQQLVVYDRQLNTTEVVSQSGQLANNWVIDGTMSPSGYSAAFTSSADNLTEEPLEATAGGLFVSLSDSIPISGHVYHWRSHELIIDVTLGLSEQFNGVSSELGSTTTDAVGEFTLANNVVGEKMITAAKEMTANDQNKVVTSADALAALKIAVGLNPNGDDSFPVSPYQMIAADVNKDGRVNSADALQILKIAVGLSDAIPQEWLFVSEAEDFWDETANNGEGEFALTNKDVSWGSEGLQFSEQLGLNSNFLGVLLGDVNGSWSAPEEAMELPDNYFASLEQAGIGPVYQWFSVIAA
ncbi:dockerin type I repeat-containing protein [Porticoccaceae bacterium]|nr:dockerin type I repeat-containing protein [Porticoccaceae bacterium]